MEIPENRLFVCIRRPASHQKFIEFWAATYTDENENLYTQNINGPHTEGSLLALFKWKMGNLHFGNEEMRQSIQNNFMSQSEKARNLPSSISAKEFLKQFSDGGPIYRIFWVHCWYPERFPIYDQHVHRAMIFIREGKIEELGEENQKIIGTYLELYLSFYEPFGKVSRDLPFDQQLDGVRGRKADRALWAFGKYLLTNGISGAGSPTPNPIHKSKEK